MAWHYGEFSCGHEGRVNIVGPLKDRGWKAERAFSRACEECQELMYQQEKEMKKEEAMKAAAEMELPALTGTEKQVTWAVTLRHQLIERFEKIKESDVKMYKNELKGLTMEEIQEVKHYIIETQTSASYYINNRSSSFVALIVEGKERMEEMKREADNKPMMDEIKKESTVYPEQAKTNAVVEIKVYEDKVEAVFERNSDFIDLVKKLGYTWEGVWTKTIIETTGAAEERAAELGNRLLNAGFPVLIVDEDIRQKAVNGEYEPECKRWIYHRKGTSRLAIQVKGFGNDLYKRARLLPGSKWDNPSVLVDVAHMDEVKDFAELNGFKFTTKALQLMEEHQRALAEANVVAPAKVKEAVEKDGLADILSSEAGVLDDLKD